MKTNVNTLSDVVVIRNILIILLVFYHAFAIFGGAWSPIKGFPEIKAYWWLDKVSYAFMLELFVFVSGYVFGYQVRVKGESKLEAKNLFWGKFKRLMIPCVIFSLLYIVMLRNIGQPLYQTAYDLINGAGHMWFLPMLFWCFVGIWIIEKIHIKTKWAVLLLVLAAICSFLPLPLRVGTAMYYMLFFFVGYVIQKKDLSLDWLYSKRYAIITSIALIILFPLLTLIKEELGAIQMGGGDNQLVTKIIIAIAQQVLKLVYAFVGIVMVLSFVGCYLKRHTVSSWMEQIGALSFGVYLFQQFILMGLYYHTTLPALVGCYWLPWVGFVVALCGSLLSTYIIRKTKIGKLIL